MTWVFEAEVNLMLSLNLIIINLFAVRHRLRSCGTDAGDFYISATSGPGVGGWRSCGDAEDDKGLHRGPRL